MQLEGVVSRINSRSGNGRKGKWTLYSFLLAVADGTEKWVTFGFDKAPPFKEGDRVNIGVNEDDKGYLTYIEGTGRIIAPKPAEKVQPSNGGSGDKPATAQTGGVSSQSNTGADRQSQIVAQHSQEMAIAMVGLLLQHDGLPVSGAKTKAGEAKRFEEIVAAVDKFTIKFHNDVVTGRLHTTVADMGIVSVTADDAIPPAGKTEEKYDKSGDDY